jgi:hypothetical protein
MADQFAKQTILNKLKTKAQAKGFNLKPDTSKMSKNVPLLEDLLDLIAEALAEVLYQDQNLPGTIKANSLKIGPGGLQMPMAYKTGTIKCDATTDPKFFAWIETFHSILQGAYPEPGNGSPDIFATVMKALLPLKPTSLTGKITNGSGSVKVTA